MCAHMVNRARHLSLLLLLFSLAASAASSACELVVFHSPACEWCETWEREVGVVYDKTAEARIAPLRRVDVHDPRPAELRALDPIVYTPTFVLLSGGREIGRIVGYLGEDHFWGLLGVLLDKEDAC